MRIPAIAIVVMATALAMGGCARFHHPPEAGTAEREPEPTVSPGTKFALLPAPVQNSIRAHAGMSDISDINKVPGDDHDVYEVTFRDFPTLYIVDNGDLVNKSDVSGLGAPEEIPETITGSGSAAKLPYAVQHTLHQAAPAAAVANVQRQHRTVYEFTFQDPQRHPRIVIADDGTILKEPPY